MGLVASLGVIYFGLPADVPRTGLASLPPLGVLEGMGALFGSLAELMPEEQTTLAGVLRVWAGLFVGCGFALMVDRGRPGRGSSGAAGGSLRCAEAAPGLHNVPRRARD